MIGYHYIGFDIHKRSIQYCVKEAGGRIVEEGRLRASRAELAEWAGRRGAPWRGAMEATMFSGWVWDVLRPYAERLQVAHPDCVVMHPGPIQRGVEIEDAVADGSRSLILTQVQVGLTVRAVCLEYALEN